MPVDHCLTGLLIGFGLPPVLTDRPFRATSAADAAWAQEHVGPLFLVAASSYHSAYCLDPSTWRYTLVLRAWTDSPAVLRCDIADELAEGLHAHPWDVSPTPAHWRRSWSGGKTRVTLATPIAARDFAAAALTASSASARYGEIAAWGARWRATHAR